MDKRSLQLNADLRVWQDERLGKLWRLAYRDGDDELVISFPDSAAMGDFIAEQFGLTLVDHGTPAAARA